MDDKLQDALRRANIEIEKSGISDPELRKIAFSKAIDFYLNENQESANQPINARQLKSKESDFWNTLSSSTQVDKAKLKDIYMLKEDQVLLITRVVRGDSKADKQRTLAALVLLAYQEGLEYDWIPSTLLSEAAKNSSLYDTSKFAENLKKHKWFRCTGKKKGARYRLSGPGTSEARNLLRLQTAND